MFLSSIRLDQGVHGVGVPLGDGLGHSVHGRGIPASEHEHGGGVAGVAACLVQAFEIGRVRGNHR